MTTDPFPSIDMNELAIGDTRTVIRWKKKVRITGAQLGNDVFISEPQPSFAAEYPYNNVQSTLSGHIREVDDTPGHERISEIHRSGTFFEIDNEGNRVTKIFGKDWSIVLEDNHIIVGGTRNVVIQGDSNIIVAGNATTKVLGNVDMKVGGDMNVNVEGTYNLIANEVFIESQTKTTVASQTENIFASNGYNNFNAVENYMTHKSYVDLYPSSRKGDFGLSTTQVIYPSPDYQLTFKNLGGTHSRIFKERYT